MWAVPPSTGAWGEGGVPSAPFLRFLQIVSDPSRVDWGSLGWICHPRPGQPAANMQAVECWGASQLCPRPVPSLALCLPSLTKPQSSLMAALIMEFISGLACPAGGPEEGGKPSGAGVGSPTPVPQRRAQPWDAGREWPPGCHTPPKTAPQPCWGLCTQVRVPWGTLVGGAGGGSWVVWLGGFGDWGEEGSSRAPSPWCWGTPLFVAYTPLAWFCPLLSLWGSWGGGGRHDTGSAWGSPHPCLAPG